MKRIYNKSNLVKGNTYHLEEKYYIHLIKVMRLNIGEQISLFNEENGEWLAKIIEIKKKQSYGGSFRANIASQIHS